MLMPTRRASQHLDPSKVFPINSTEVILVRWYKLIIQTSNALVLALILATNWKVGFESLASEGFIAASFAVAPAHVRRVPSPR